MARMPFHDDGISRGERRGRVSTACSECERKIARAENGHRSTRNEHSAKIGLRKWLPIRIGGVNHRFDPGAFSHDLCEHAKLAASTSALAREARPRQGRFKLAAFQ